MPEKRFARMFCTDRLSARPAMLMTATREAVGMPSAPAMMTMASAHSAMRTAFLIKPCRTLSIFLERASSFSTAFMRILIAIRQTRKTRIAEITTFPPESPRDSNSESNM